MEIDARLRRSQYVRSVTSSAIHKIKAPTFTFSYRFSRIILKRSFVNMIFMSCKHIWLINDAEDFIDLYRKSYSTKYRSTIEIINLKMTFNNASIIWKSDVLLLNVLDGTQGCAELSNFVFKVYINVRGKSDACIDKYTFH